MLYRKRTRVCVRVRLRLAGTPNILTHGQWWSNRSTQLSHRLQWEARGGRKILHVKQYFSLTVWPLTRTSLVRGGGRNVGLLSEFGTSANPARNQPNKQKTH